MTRVGLFGFERRLARHIFETILPSGKEERLSQLAHHAPVEQYLSDLFRTAPLRVCVGFRLLLWVVALAPLPSIGRFATFGGLSPGERLAVLRSLKASRYYLLREIPLFFKAFACFGVLAMPATQQALLLQPRDRTPPSWAPAAERGAAK
jgi:hypothetical protein